MADFRFTQLAVAKLLCEFPGELADDLRRSLQANVDAGEPELTFDAICSWLHELEVSVSAGYFRELEDVRRSLGLDSNYLDYLRPQIASAADE